MNKHKKKRERPMYWKRRFASALCMLLIATIMLGVTSYAWLVMSIAPEATGMTANVGANGSLEIALLNAQTRQDMTQISSMGGSLASRNPSANNSWGNVIDLSYSDYGLQEMVLWPSRLNLIQAGDKYIVDSSLLAVPTYGYDGRIIELTDDTVTGTYNGSAFSTVLGLQDYGVRVVGTADSLSPQNAALALAKSNIKTYMNSANEAASGSMNASGNGLLNIMMDRSRTYTDDDLQVLKTMIKDLQVSLDYIDLALRQGMVAAAASVIANEDMFSDVKDMILDTSIPLSTILDTLTETYELNESYAAWIEQFIATQNNLNAANNECNALTGGAYTWAQLKKPLDYIMNVEKVFINEEKFSEFDSSKATELLGGDVVITLASGSGVFADIADFTGNFDTWVTYIVKIQITTMTGQDPVYLQALSEIVAEMEAADGSVAGESSVDLTTTYGYVVDMAFRTNAAISDLLLQTTPSQRVYEESDNARTMGGGSYMEFTTDDESLELDRMLQLMDAIRVAFVDDQGVLLGIAKLNTSNRVVSGEKVKAPLYLYSFHIDEEDGSLQMDERQKTSNVLTALEQNTAKAVSTIVWLDGDTVDNTMVSATEETSLNGVLNLQFASSANLIASGNTGLMNITSDKKDLAEKITEQQSTVDAGQGTYTTESWEAYVTAYEYAVSVNENAGANEHQIYTAAAQLQSAIDGLTFVNMDALVAKISQIRDVMGSVGDIKSLLFYDEETDTVINLGEYNEAAGELSYTQEEFDSSTVVYGVDYQMNFNDEGNGVLTQIYSDASWSALAAALYAAERVVADPKATDSELDAAITALETAYNALERMVYYIPYEYEGVVYYLAISEETDTYGKWYDSDFKRVTSDLRILQLDAKAEQITDIGYIEQDYYVSSTSGFITPYVGFYDKVYTKLNTSVKALMWNLPDQFELAITGEQSSALRSFVIWSRSLTEPVEGVRNYESAIDMYTQITDNANLARNIVSKGKTATFAEAAALIPVITKLQADYELFLFESEMSDGEYEHYKAKYAKDYATADQITVLTVAINSGKCVDSWDTAEDKAELKAAIEAAEALLVSVTDDDFQNRPTVADADAVLEALNAQLKAQGLEEVTVANYITVTVPVSEDTYEMLYVVQDNPMSGIVVNDKLGEATITAVVLTENGVVFTMSKDIMVYSPAGGSEISYQNSYDTAEGLPLGGTITEYAGVPAWDTYNAWDRTVQPGETLQLSVSLNDRLVPQMTENGYHEYVVHELKNEDGEVIESQTEYLYTAIAHTENAVDYVWSSSDTNVAQVVTTSANGGCTVKTVGIGTATISVTVTTREGNQYTASFDICVEGITFGTDVDIAVGEQFDFASVLTNKDGELITDGEYVYSWSCGDTDIVTVENADSPICTITGVARGAADLTLSAVRYDENENIIRQFTRTVTVYVDMLPVQNVILSATNNEILIGDVSSLTVTLSPSADNYEKAVSYEWSADSDKVISLTWDNAGNCTATGLAEGEVSVSVTVITERGTKIIRSVTITVAEPEESNVPTVTETN